MKKFDLIQPGIKVFDDGRVDFKEDFKRIGKSTLIKREYKNFSAVQSICFNKTKTQVFVKNLEMPSTSIIPLFDFSFSALIVCDESFNNIQLPIFDDLREKYFSDKEKILLYNLERLNIEDVNNIRKWPQRGKIIFIHPTFPKFGKICSNIEKNLNYEFMVLCIPFGYHVNEEISQQLQKLKMKGIIILDLNLKEIGEKEKRMFYKGVPTIIHSNSCQELLRNLLN